WPLPRAPWFMPLHDGRLPRAGDSRGPEADPGRGLRRVHGGGGNRNNDSFGGNWFDQALKKGK
ncbi:MAG: hypothetical protein ACPGUY_01755, partial [Akkermansiaceae bacterium]